MLPKVSIDDVVVREIRRHEDPRGWLSELFREDELASEFHPAMSYISMTHAGATRGPHEHVDQADLFCFIGPSTFRIYLWDNRLDSGTHGNHDRFDAGEDHPLMVLVPKGVVHAYKNIGAREGMVINCPNRLYAGPGRKQPIDEIRHEDDPDGPFQVD
ncbi:MAG: dTDP-4-dehydrorhamnose 3,5-epimerase family protein [Deltaproteobacteria bacterium]|nr:dTDP-4-dehydrorhamnose 3,5-epimerase family protein [Deltaproteobacteria bacterium]